VKNANVVETAAKNADVRHNKTNN